MSRADGGDARCGLSAAGIAHAGLDRRGQSAAGAVGAFALNMSTITAAILPADAHVDPARRYMASVFAGCFTC